MARLPRLSLADVPHHVLQRGINSQPVFDGDDDYRRMLELLRELAPRLDVRVHGYCLLPGCVHLLMTPSDETAIGRIMQSLSRDYVRSVNRARRRTGTLWDGRYRSTLLEAQSLVVSRLIFLDSLPVWSGVAGQAEQYPWSSHGSYAGTEPESWISVPDPYWRLGNTPFERQAVYLRHIREGLDQRQREEIQASVYKGWPMGSAAFLNEVERRSGRRVRPRKAGRPPVQPSSCGGCGQRR
ncbi:MAG: transposase [Panacagrimonas sp.]